jgi:signal transduction histidine kinase
MLKKAFGVKLRHPDEFDDRASFGGDGAPNGRTPDRRGQTAQFPGRLGSQWHTSTFRWLAVFAPIFVISLMVLIAFIEFSVTRAMQSAADSGIRWQLRYFDSTPDEEIGALIERRLEREHRHTNYYGLFDTNGKRVAGDIVEMPVGLTLDSPNVGHSDTNGVTLTLMGNPSLPVVRVMGERRADGTRLVIARSLNDVTRVRDELKRALIAGGAVCLLANLAAGLLLSLRQMRRVAEMRRTTGRIANGDLNQRLALRGRDELDMLAHLVNRMLDEIERLIREIKGTCDGIAHDLRTPLVRLRLQLGYLAEHANGQHDGAAAELIERVRLEADSVLERFNAMLRISEIGTMQRRSGFGVVAPETLIDELVGLYQPLAEEKSIRLAWQVEAVDPLHGDRGLLFEALSNLLHNAIKFAPPGGDVCVTMRRSEAGPVVSIEDNGPGIPADEREAVFGQFYRAKHTKHVPGTGLGLAIVAAIVRLHDFELRISGRVQGEREAGTVITVECWPHLMQPSG